MLCFLIGQIGLARMEEVGSMKALVVRITERQWYDLGGFSRVGLFRKARQDGAWSHYVDLDLFEGEILG